MFEFDSLEDVSEEEGKKLDKEQWEKLKLGQMISFYTEKIETPPIFALTSRKKNDSWEVVIFSEQNRKNLISGEKCETSDIKLDSIICLLIMDDD